MMTAAVKNLHLSRIHHLLLYWSTSSYISISNPWIVLGGSSFTYQLFCEMQRYKCRPNCLMQETSFVNVLFPGGSKQFLKLCE